MCVVVLAIILYAGLSPFTFHPQNQVTWLPTGGLHFGDNAIVYSQGEFTPQENSVCCTVEIALRPGLGIDTNTILCLRMAGKPCHFRVRQLADDLVLNGAPAADGRPAAIIDIDHVFRRAQPVLITVVSGPDGTSVYVNGQLARRSPAVLLVGAQLAGRMIVGGAPIEDDSWSGDMLGIGLYDRQFAPEEVSSRFQQWSASGRLKANPPGAIALYAFDELKGNIVRNAAPSAQPALYIPPSFRVFDQAFLMPFWKEFQPNWGYVKDIIINVGGFVPLGFTFAAWFRHLKLQRPMLATLLFGFAVSLAIELLQSHMPTRQSGTTDLITNTTGTALGAILLFRGRGAQVIVRSRVGQVR